MATADELLRQAVQWFFAEALPQVSLVRITIVPEVHLAGPGKESEQ